MSSDPRKGRGRPVQTDELGEPSDLSSLDPSPSEEDYRVGKGHPPRHAQFKPGNRGGPGRPKGSKNRATLFAEAFDTMQTVTIKGRKRKMSAQQLGYQQLSRKVAQGDLKAIDLAEKIRNTLFPAESVADPVAPPLTEAELAILRRHQND